MTRLMHMARTSLGLAAGLVLTHAATAQTQQVCFTDAIPLTTTNWNSSVTVSKFDPALGTLQSIFFEITGHVTGTARAESLDGLPTVVNIQFSSTMTLTRPDTSVIVIVIPLANFSDPLSAFDGVIDFGGTSGVTHPAINATQMNSATSPPPPGDIALFTGLIPGNPGTITLPVTAAGSSVASGPGNVISQFNQSAEATVRVCYTYEPNVAPSFVAPTPQCGSILMATANVPLSFQVCAGDGQANDTITLNGVLPLGATTVPALPAVGNPVCVTVNWTPTLAQLGNSNFSFTAVDTHGRTAACSLGVLTAECYQFLGRGGGGSDVNIGGTPFHTQMDSVRSLFPVTMVDRPHFRVPLLTSGQINFSFETVMHNPIVFPQNPDQWSQRLRVSVLPGGVVQGQLFGTFNGIHQQLQTFTDPNGDLYMSFPFTIDGM